MWAIKKKYSLSLVSFLFISPSAQADNWHGSITSKLQVDNRLTSFSSVFAEAIGRFEYQNKQYDLQGGADVLLRGGNDDFNNRQDFYRLFLQKGFKALNTTLKLGRFEQTDTLGFYTLNGASVSYQASKKLVLETYAGKPQRFDDLQEAKGNVVVGAKSFWHEETNWHSDSLKLSLDSFDLRLGYQYFDGPDVSRYFGFGPIPNTAFDAHKFSWGSNLAGKLNWPGFKKYELRMIGVFRADTQNFEDLQIESQIDFQTKTRLRASYEYYRPDRFENPTFREQFYSQYGFGKQQLLRLSIHHQWFENLTLFVGGMHSALNSGEDGYGISGGLTTRIVRNVKTDLEMDHLNLNFDSATALYLRNEYFINAKNSATLSLAIRHEDKQLYGENWVKGAELRWSYFIKNNIVLGLTHKYIWNSRISDEFLSALQVTYYFDNFKPKTAQ